jgi:hypothetical protein
MTPDKSLGESVIEIGNEIHDSILTASDPTKIDWTNIRTLLALFFDKFGPIIIPLLITWLTPKKPE